jgi:hypothetical protein
MEIPEEKRGRNILNFLGTLPRDKLLELSDLGNQSASKYNLIKQYQLWLWFEHEIDVVFFSSQIPVWSSYNRIKGTYEKHQPEVTFNLRINK